MATNPRVMLLGRGCLPFCAVLLLLSAAGCCNSSTESGRQGAVSASASTSPMPAAPRNLSVAKATPEDVRNGLKRLGWSLQSELSTQFDSCKTAQFDATNAGQEAHLQLHDCADEYDARRKESSLKSLSSEGVFEREGGHLFEVTVRDHKDAAQKLFAGILGR